MMKRIQINKVFFMIMLMLFLTYFQTVIAQNNDIVVNSDATVNQEKCKQIGGVYSEVGDGRHTQCRLPNGIVITCDSHDHSCLECKGDPLLDQCRVYRETNLPGNIISGQATNNIPLVAPVDTPPTIPKSTIGEPQLKPTVSIVAPAKNTSQTTPNKTGQSPSVLVPAPAMQPSATTNKMAPDNRSSVTATPLSPEECKTLGGKVGKLSICKSGSVCQTTDESGKVHSVCLKTVGSVLVDLLKGKDKPKPSQSKQLPDFSKAMTPTGAITVAPLTNAECTGLGGKVISTNKCEDQGQQACATVGSDGVVRTLCIDKVKRFGL